MKAKSTKRISYDEQRNKCREFLINFEEFESGFIHDRYGRKRYLIRLV